MLVNLINMRNKTAIVRDAAVDLYEALDEAKAQILALGGDPRCAIATVSSADEDEIQAAVLDKIEAAIAKAER